MWKFTIIPALVACIPFTTAINLDVNDTASIRGVATTLAYDLQSLYHNNQSDTPPQNIGTLDPPLYWWEAGAVWGAMIDYTTYTNDTSYNQVITQALLAQVGPDYNYMPPAFFTSLGNDDQSFWAFAVLSAMEYDFPFPEGQPIQGWLDLAVAVWETQAAVWNTTLCGGGLKWQKYPTNRGYDYRNSIANGGFLQISARLARYTGNQTYVEWATKTWDWMTTVGLISDDYLVYDGTGEQQNCTELDHTQWSYNPAVLIYGTSMLANHTNDAIWKTRTEGLLASIESTFFSPYPNATNIIYEPACEPANHCNNDQFSFKAYLSRWLSKSAILCPDLAPAIRPRLATSARAAAHACSGGLLNRTCGQKWYVGGFDGATGLGQQLSALETVQGLLVLAEPRVPSVGGGGGVEGA